MLLDNTSIFIGTCTVYEPSQILLYIVSNSFNFGSCRFQLSPSLEGVGREGDGTPSVSCTYFYDRKVLPPSDPGTQWSSPGMTWYSLKEIHFCFGDNSIR